MGKRVRRLQALCGLSLTAPRTLMPYKLTRREVVCGGLILAVSGGGSRNLHCTAYTGSGLAFAGVTLAGAEFGKVPGTYATDYTYP